MKTTEMPSNPKASPFSRLSLAGIVIGLLLGGLTVFAFERGMFRFSHLSQTDAVATVKKLQVLRYPKQTADAQKLCTAFGWPIMEKLTSDKHEFLGNFRIGQVKLNPELTDVQMVEDTAEGKSVLWVRLRPVNGNYKFNNVYIEEFRGFPVKMRVSEIYSHPEELQKCLAPIAGANFDARVQRFNEVTTGIGNILDIFIKLRDLSENKR